jgi:uncharacterized protein YaaN involved in tellurite resistance
MKIEIEDETADNITLETLKTSYENLFETLEKTLSDEEFTAVYSFNFDEEVFSIIKELKALELIIGYFGGSIKTPVETFIKEKNEEIYLIDKTMEELKKENQILKNKNHCLEEELEELKTKIKNLVG